MKRGRVLVLDGPLAGKRVPDYGRDCKLLEPWTDWTGSEYRSPIIYTLQTFFWRTPEGFIYIVRGYVRRYRTVPGDIPHTVRVALAAQALLSS